MGWGIAPMVVGSPASRILNFSVGFAIQAPPPFPGGGEHGGARFLPAWWLAGRLVPAPSSAGSALAGCCCRLAVVVVLSCLLVVLAGSRDDGGRTRECYMRMRGGRRVGRCGASRGGGVCVPSLTRVCVWLPVAFCPVGPRPGVVSPLDHLPRSDLGATRAAPICVTRKGERT